MFRSFFSLTSILQDEGSHSTSLTYNSSTLNQTSTPPCGNMVNMIKGRKVLEMCLFPLSLHFKELPLIFYLQSYQHHSLGMYLIESQKVEGLRKALGEERHPVFYFRKRGFFLRFLLCGSAQVIRRAEAGI